MPESRSPRTEALRKALQDHGWFVADVINAGYIESSEWEPVLAEAAAPRSGEDEAYRRGFTDGRGEPPERGTVTQCPIEGVHEHTFRGPHGFREWYGAFPSEPPTP